MDKFLIEVANELEDLLIYESNPYLQDNIDSLQDKVLEKIESPWRYDRETDRYIICSQEEWEKREAEETC